MTRVVKLLELADHAGLPFRGNPEELHGERLTFPAGEGWDGWKVVASYHRGLFDEIVAFVRPDGRELEVMPENPRPPLDGPYNHVLVRVFAGYMPGEGARLLKFSSMVPDLTWEVPEDEWKAVAA